MIVLHLFLLISIVNGTYLYFEENTIEITLLESTKVHTKISSIKAIASSSLSIEYELHGDTNRTFFLNSQTGDLILLKQLDYETIPIYKLTIEARSSSIVPCFSELIIHILNINDNPPEIHIILYPSVLYESNIIKYDLNSSSTPFATINIKDLDQSTEYLSLILNDTEYFQIQLIRQMKMNLVYILSIKNQGQLLDKEYLYLSMNVCDHDQPELCTNRTYQFHFQSNEYLCNLSFNQKNYIIDIDEQLPNQSLIMKKLTNKFCENIIYSIDDQENFFIDSNTGDLYTNKRFHRIERSIYIIHLYTNNLRKIKIIVRILDQFGNIPFLLNKNLISNSEQFISIQLANSTYCRAQSIIETYFQLLSNCTIIRLIKPPQGQYLFHIELFQHRNYRDTFLLELQQDYQPTLKQSSWIIILSILFCLIILVGIIIAIVFILKQRYSRFNHRPSPLSIEDDGHYNRFDRLTTTSKLKVHDDQISTSPTNHAIYLIGKSSPLSSTSVPRDDEGYSGSSDASENHPPYKTTVISANDLLEQYHVHDFRRLQSAIYDVPRRSIERIEISNASLV